MSNLDERLREILAHDVLGMTMRMVDNVYLNTEPKEFEEFLLEYSKQRHKFEPDMSRCDGCNGVEMAGWEIKQAFEDEGWQEPGSGLRNNRMTGQEFYGRFEKELRGYVIPCRDKQDEEEKLELFNYVKQAAKKAAGLDV